MNTIENQEHLEKYQLDTNIERDDFVKSLLKEDREKFEAVEKAVKILIDAKVLFYLFPQLPYLPDKTKNQVWQWNSLLHFAEYDNAGKFTLEYLRKNKNFNHGMLSYIFYMFTYKLEIDFMSKLESFKDLIWKAVSYHSKILRGEDPYKEKDE